ncbi:hypothetical protein ATANTOWER_016200 [Ataeniobius toweri]|uniref:Uncharacterized protein n=1 Tax=Ataeniobius toweri TaxID=208326 RepID=A0ABU7AQ06_9TELE|nr:hypothetical protein [Ataeniobius toweri]
MQLLMLFYAQRFMLYMFKGWPSVIRFCKESRQSHVKRLDIKERGELCILNCCVVLAEVDNNGIPSFPTKTRSCSDGKGGGGDSFKCCLLESENRRVVISSLTCKVNKRFVSEAGNTGT